MISVRSSYWMQTQAYPNLLNVKWTPKYFSSMNVCTIILMSELTNIPALFITNHPVTWFAEHTVDIKCSKSRTRQSNSLTLVCESGRDKHSSYWKGSLGHHIENYPWVELYGYSWLVYHLQESAGCCTIGHPPSSVLCPFRGGQCQSATGPLADYLSRQDKT